MTHPRLWYGLYVTIGAMLLCASGCDMEVRGNWQQTQHERVLDQSAPLSSGSKLDVDTSSGSITINGAEVNECSVTATITGRAPSAEEAQAIAEQVTIRLDRAGDTLKIRADEPKLTNNRSVSVSYAITAPRRMSVDCHSAYGSLNLSHLEGTVNAKTGSGSIEAEHIQGTTHLDTAYGSIRCHHITGPEVSLHSGSGSVEASDIQGTARMASSYGSVKCERFSDGDLLLKSGSGRVTVADATFGTCEATSSYGPVVGHRLEGDSITFRSGSGSVKVTGGTAKALDLSSSYGSVGATQIVTQDIKAHSGSGSIDVDCTGSCPTDLKADAKTSYGSVDFAAPTDFAGRVYLVTHYGSVHTERPITLSGEISKKKVAGVIGDGRGDLRLESGSGSIHLK